MRFPVSTKIELCVSKDETRYNLMHVHLDVGAKAMIATDGHRLVHVNVVIDDTDTSGPIPVAAIDAARKYAKKMRLDKAEVRCDGQHVVVTTANGDLTFTRPPNVNFPDWRQVVGTPGPYRIGFNARYLKEIAEALSDDKLMPVDIQITDELSPIRVTCGTSGYAVLMPMRINSDPGAWTRLTPEQRAERRETNADAVEAVERELAEAREEIRALKRHLDDAERDAKALRAIAHIVAGTKAEAIAAVASVSADAVDGGAM